MMKPLLNYDGYFIKENGDVFLKRNNFFKKLKIGIQTNGYCYVCLGRKNIRLHRLVALVFKAKGIGDQVRHLDGDKLNNHISNLMFGTAKENAQDRERHGNTAKGIKQTQAKLNDEKVLKIKNLLSDKIPQRKIATMFSVSQKLILNINKGRDWKHV